MSVAIKRDYVELQRAQTWIQSVSVVSDERQAGDDAVLDGRHLVGTRGDRAGESASRFAREVQAAIGPLQPE